MFAITEGELGELIYDTVRTIMYSGWRRMVTGYKNPDGSVTMEGAPTSKVWVRPPEDSRGGVAVWGSAAMPNAPVWVGPGPDGDLEIKDPDWQEATERVGEGARIITQPPGMDELLPANIPAKSLKIGKVELSPNGGLNFRVSAFAHSGGYWTSTADQDASGEEPGTTGEVCWTGAYLDPAANTVGVVSTTPIYGEPQDLDESDLATLVYPTGAIPLGAAFSLKNGQTQLSQSRFSDLDPRIFLGTPDDGSTGATFGAGVIKTLASDVAAAGDDRHLILAAQSSTADDLIEITGLNIGDEVILRADAGDTITVKHDNAGATDKIILYNAVDIALTGDDTLKLAKIASGKVVQYVDKLGTGGSGSSESAAYASRPAAGTDGALFLPTDAYALWRDDGADWIPFGPMFALTEPPTSGWTLDDRHTVSVTQAKGAITLATTTLAGEVSTYYRTAPSAPYTITACILMTLIVKGGTGATSTIAEAGLVFRQSSDGKLAPFTIGEVPNGARSLTSAKWTDYDTFSAVYVGERFYQQPVWFRIADDNTNRICSISQDGQNFDTFHSVGRTDFLTADQIGICLRSQTTTGTLARATLISWKEA